MTDSGLLFNLFSQDFLLFSAADPESRAQQMVDRESRAGSGSSWTGWYLESPGLDPAVLDRLEKVPDGI